MKPFLTILFAFALLAATTSCEKEEVDALPKATQEGKNTFGCLVDGNAYIPTLGSAISINSRELLEAYIYQHRDLVVSAKGGGAITIILRNRFAPGTYPLGYLQAGNYSTYTISGRTHYTDVDHMGTVTLTRIDTVAKIAAGTFEFTALDYQSGKIVTITEGRFDVRLR